MTKLAKNTNQIFEDEVVSPTQYQMDQWIEQELSEAEQTQMLADETPTALFEYESID